MLRLNRHASYVGLESQMHRARTKCFIDMTDLCIVAAAGALRSPLVGAIVILVAGCIASAFGREIGVQSSEVVGTLSVVWADVLNRPSSVLTFLTSDNGETREVALSTDDVARLGGMAALQGLRVRAQLVAADRRVQGSPATVFEVSTLSTDPRDPGNTPDTPPLAVTGSVRYIVLLCRYTDSALLVNDPLTHYAGMFGSNYPGLDHYWRDVSFGNVNLTGSRVEGWFNLPGAWADYWNPDGYALDLTRILADCTAAADAQVDFRDFDGIVMFTPKPANVRYPAAYGSAGSFLTRDGVSRSYRTAWIPFEACAQLGCGGSAWLLGHEMGHSLGLPHSSGPYGDVYDSGWDVMSGSYFTRCDPGAIYACVGKHTIGYHKSLLGWIPSGRALSLSTGTTEIELLPLDVLPSSGPGVLLAKLPVAGSSAFYTVEARRPIGYDDRLPRATVLIHRVNPTSPAVGGSHALVMDGTNTDPNRNPNDDEAMWTAGETFVDVAAGLLVEVLNETVSGWRVALTAHPPGLPLARRDTYITARHAPLTVAAPGVLGNDSAATGGTLAASLVASPAHGVLTLTPSGAFSYTPNLAYAGTDSFTYSAANAAGTSNTTTVSITVLAETPPTANNDSYAGSRNQAIVVATPGVLVNDVSPDGSALSATIAANPANGTVFLSTNGGFTYTPNSGFVGLDTFTYRVVSGTGQGNTATVALTIQDVTTAQPPTALVAHAIVGNTVTLRWTPPTTGPTPTGYVVEGGILPGQTLAALPTGSAAPLFTFVAPTGIFHLRLRTVAGGFTSTNVSNEIRVYINVAAPPSPPTNLLGLVNGQSLALAWRNTYGGGTPDSVILDVSGALTTSLPLGLTDSFTFNPVPSGSYTFTVRTANRAGASGASNPVTLNFPNACAGGAPQTPEDFLAYRVGNVVNLLWEPASTGTAPTGYVVNVSGAFNGALPVQGRAVSAGVPTGTYRLSIAAVNECGVSAATAVRTVGVQ